MKIIFYSSQLSLRGSEIALFDYADYNEKLLNNESVVVYLASSELSDPGAIEKFEGRFKTYAIESFSEVDRIITKEQAHLLYKIVNGKPDGKLSELVPTAIHAVFPRKESDIHGAAYAYVSDWLSDYCSDGCIPSVPHIMVMPELTEGVENDLRDELKIPESATVFGCYGGEKSFNISFVKEEAIPRALELRDDLYFIFMNISPFMKHERVLFLPGTAEINYKIRFINTTDAMLHARMLGESFGLACGEFSMRNKPVLTYSRSRQRNHIEVLGDRGMLYSNANNLTNLLVNFDRDKTSGLQWDCYSERFSPENVMALFNEHLIQPALKNGVALHPGIKFGLWNKIRMKLKELRFKIAYYFRLL